MSSDISATVTIMVFLMECFAICLPQYEYVSIVANDDSDVTSENSALGSPRLVLTGFMKIPRVLTRIPIPPPEINMQQTAITQP